MIPHVKDAKEDLDEVDLTYEYDKDKEVKWTDKLLLNRPLKLAITFLLIAIIAPLLIYHFVFVAGYDHPPTDGLSFGSCLVPRHARLLCGLGSVTSQECHAQCCYDHANNMCFHRFPSRFSYISQRNWTEDTVLRPRVGIVPFASQRSISNIRLSIDEVSSTHLSLNFYHSEDLIEGRRLEQKEYGYEVSHPELNVVVNASERNLFNTMRGPLIASNDIWEISFKLTDDVMYGLGEIPLQENTVKVIYAYDGGLNSIPLIFAKNNGSYHGLLIDNVNPTEISFRGENQIVVRSITRAGLKFHLFVGPEPVDVMNDVIKLLGFKMDLKYWMLGAHICSETSYSTFNMTVLRNFVNAATAQRIPYESHCGVAPIVFDDECNSTNVDIVDQGATVLKNAGKRFVPHVSPYIRYTEINETYENTTETKPSQGCTKIQDFEQNIIRDSQSDRFYIGLVDGRDVIYPNYGNVSKEFMGRLWLYTSEVDGLVLENNWPLDERVKGFGDIRRYLPYFNESFEVAFAHTPQWNATQPNDDRYFYTHNKFGNQFAAAFQKIKGPIPTVATSQWMSRHLAVNRQNIPTSWNSLQRELIQASLGGISGQWLWSSPICGDTETFNVDIHTRLCAKWYMAATYLPMIRIHTKETERDPASFLGTHRTHMITALHTRLSLLPYFYSVLQEGPLLRPMFYQYPKTESLSNLTTQFAVGDDLLIVPNLLPSQSHVHVWMPPGVWYEFWSGMRINAEEGEAVTMTTTEADFLTLLRGGSIIARQKDTRLTAEETQLSSPISLTIALHSISLEPRIQSENITIYTANGKLYMTENMTIKFEADDEKVIITAVGDDFNCFCDINEAVWTNTVKDVNIYGLRDDKNNYDHHRLISIDIDLCRLKSEEYITVEYF